MNNLLWESSNYHPNFYSKITIALEKDLISTIYPLLVFTDTNQVSGRLITPAFFMQLEGISSYL